MIIVVYQIAIIKIRPDVIDFLHAWKAWARIWYWITLFEKPLDYRHTNKRRGGILLILDTVSKEHLWKFQKHLKHILLIQLRAHSCFLIIILLMSQFYDNTWSPNPTLIYSQAHIIDTVCHPAWSRQQTLWKLNNAYCGTKQLQCNLKNDT